MYLIIFQKLRLLRDKDRCTGVDSLKNRFNVICILIIFTLSVKYVAILMYLTVQNYLCTVIIGQTIKSLFFRGRASSMWQLRLKWRKYEL